MSTDAAERLRVGEDSAGGCGDRAEEVGGLCGIVHLCEGHASSTICQVGVLIVCSEDLKRLAADVFNIFLNNENYRLGQHRGLKRRFVVEPKQRKRI